MSCRDLPIAAETHAEPPAPPGLAPLIVIGKFNSVVIFRSRNTDSGKVTLLGGRCKSVVLVKSGSVFI
jgi:hypothetical protein